MPREPFVGSISFKHAGKLRGDIEVVSTIPNGNIQATRLVVKCYQNQMAEVTWEYEDGTHVPHPLPFRVMDWGNTYFRHAAPAQLNAFVVPYQHIRMPWMNRIDIEIRTPGVEFQYNYRQKEDEAPRPPYRFLRLELDTQTQAYARACR
ncbi:hypothetical protein PLICRDRAFT_28405 [Plicaturopsis crispa FD-325 SS-3]|nr:hypothetical protein PLICRDRAFT_28405 [Plicaturopsis crispa FD-325 SS-3]